MSKCYSKNAFHAKHKRSENWPILGEHVAPLCEPTPHINHVNCFEPYLTTDLVFQYIAIHNINMISVQWYTKQLT